MRFSRRFLPLVALLALSGCGYVHFGRLPKAGAQTDAALLRAYSDLGTQHKILKQELALTRKETDTLRAALERATGASTPTPELARKLEETARELATLRVAYAKLQSERSASPAPTELEAKLAKTEEKLATSLRDYTQLQEANSRLQRELNEARSRNATLAEQLASAVTETRQAQSELAQLNTELLAQKQARDRAEQATVALRAQLSAVMARVGPAESANARSPSSSENPPLSPPAEVSASAPVAPAAPAVPANSLAGLQLAKEPPSEAAPRVELRMNIDRLRAANGAPVASQPAATSSPDSAAAPSVVPSDTTSPATAPSTPAADAKAAAAPRRTYTVQTGDTLEKIAQRVYGAADRWGKIYEANRDLLSANPGLKPGTELQIPED